MKLAAARRLSDNYGWSKFDLSECPRINDRQPGRGFATPKNADFCIYRTASKPRGISMEKIVSLVTAMTRRKCHCEEKSDEAISKEGLLHFVRNDSGNPVASYREFSS